MCGIVGIISMDNLTEIQKEMFAWLSHFDAVRGDHGTGYFWVTNQNEVGGIKRKGRPELLWNDVASREVMDENGVLKMKNLRVLVGHNRAATNKSTISDINAHPFQHKSIIGVHNGVFHNTFALPGNYDVDSEHAFAALASGMPLKEVIEKGRPEYALVYYDSEAKMLNIARNDDRPLYGRMTKSGRTLIFASEDWMIQRAYSRATRDTTNGGLEDKFQFTANRSYQFPLDNLKLKGDWKIEELPEVKKFWGAGAAPTGNAGSASNSYRPQTNTVYNTNHSRVIPHKSDKLGSEVTVPLFNKLLLQANSPSSWTSLSFADKDQYDREVTSNCICCGANVDYEGYQGGNVRFMFDAKSPVCADCAIELYLEQQYLLPGQGDR